MVVLSLWDGGRCTGTVRVAAHDVPMLMEALGAGLQPPAPLAPAAAPLARVVELTPPPEPGLPEILENG